MKCKECKIDKVKEPVVRGNITRFVDDKGQVWNGACCPSCYRLYNKARMKASRTKQNATLSPKQES